MSTPRNVRWFELLLLLLMVAAGCGGAVTDVTPVTPPDTVVRTLVPNPPKVTIETGGPFGLPSCKGRVVPLGVVAKNSSGSVLNPGIYWASSDSSLVPVNRANGMAESRDVVGKVSATATTAGLTATVEVEVVRTAACRDTVSAVIVSVSDTSTMIVDGPARQITARSLPDSADQSGTWSSSAPGVLTVDSNGLASAKNEGSANICFTSLNKTKGCRNMGARYPTFTIALKKASSLGVGFINLVGTGCTDTSVEITSSIPAAFTPKDASILSVSQVNDTLGIVSGISQGATTVLATDRYGRKLSAVVAVSAVKCTP